MPRIYLDTCVWGRPFDEQSQVRIKEESEAFFQILHELDAGRVVIIGSVVLEDEVARIKDVEKREAVSKLIEWSISEKVVDIIIIKKFNIKVLSPVEFIKFIREGK